MVRTKTYSDQILLHPLQPLETHIENSILHGMLRHTESSKKLDYVVVQERGHKVAHQAWEDQGRCCRSEGRQRSCRNRDGRANWRKRLWCSHNREREHHWSRCNGEHKRLWCRCKRELDGRHSCIHQADSSRQDSLAMPLRFTDAFAARASRLWLCIALMLTPSHFQLASDAGYTKAAAQMICIDEVLILSEVMAPSS